MYDGLKSDCESDPLLVRDLNKAKKQLQAFYQTNYANRAQPLLSQPSQSLSSISSQTSSSLCLPEKVNFTSWYQKKDRVVVDELEEYFKLPCEDFDSCKPLHWWLGRRSQFPNLYCLVRDVFSIPGKLMMRYFIFSLIYCSFFVYISSAVAVERIFSGGRDTISLRRASLVPDTIRVLMLVKHCLRLARIQLEKEDRYK